MDGDDRTRDGSEGMIDMVDSGEEQTLWWIGATLEVGAYVVLEERADI